MKKLFSMVVMFLLVFTLSACSVETDDPNVTPPVVEEEPEEVINYLEVTIEIGEEVYQHEVEESLQESLTVFDLVKDNYNLNFTTSVFGVYVVSLEDLNPKAGQYIMVSENGEMAMSGIGELMIEDGDVFSFDLVWYDSLLEEIDTTIALFLDNHINQYINESYIDVNVLSALHLMGLSEEYLNGLDINWTTMFDPSTMETTADYFKAIVILDIAGEDTTELLASYSEMASVGPYGQSAYGLMILQKDEESYEDLLATFENDLTVNTPFSLGLDAGGISLVALANSDMAERDLLVDEFVAWIQEDQLDTGGIKTRDMTWGDTTYPGTENAASMAQVIIGLLANGIDPTSAEFTVGESNLVSRLLDFNTEDGAFDYLLDDELDVDLMFSTPQAFLAIVLVQEYKAMGSGIHPYAID